MITTYGNESNPPIVLLHGFLGTHRDWKEITDVLKANWYCIVPDLPGHGENTSVAKEPSQVKQALKSIHFEVMQSIQQPFHLLGYSLGGRVALKWAAEHPESIISLCLESAHPGLLTEPERQQRVRADKIWANRLRNEPITEVLRDWYRQPVFSQLSANQIEELVDQHQEQTPAPLANSLEQLGLGKQRSFWRFLAKWDKPLLYISGEQDLKFNGIGNKLTDSCGKAHHAIITNASHNCHWQQKKQYIEVLIAFLENIRS